MSEAEERWGPPWTVLKLLEWSTDFFGQKGIDSPRLTAELMLSHVLRMPRVQLYAQFDRPASPEELTAYRALVKRRAMREPVEYIVGSRGFWTFDLKTDPRALIPRPDTEILVEEALARIPQDSDATVVDVGTGTGAIALALASERPNLAVIATDISDDALGLAGENADALGLQERVQLRQGDLLAPITDADGSIFMIVSNPPYVAQAVAETMQPEVVNWEPHTALFAGPNGLDVIERLAAAAYGRLQPGGWHLIEIGFDQGESAPQVLRSAGFVDVTTRKDYAGNTRVAAGRKE